MEPILEPFIVEWLVLGLSAVVLILVIWNLAVGRRLKRLRRDYRAMMAETGVDNLEQLLADLQSRVTQGEHKLAEHENELVKLYNGLRLKKGNVGIHRYNAFSTQGSDMSFSIAIINDEQDGIVLSGLHTREETYVYAKPLVNGESPYPLTPEEKQAINQAVQPK
ncbi:DUF4446 domain-containing protein [Paenibacillus sambharensis]|uniref:DUF4446 domain-containing protein n=1 Tax=Paenibacillus sambharensis TaxID=1803190 RepID=A0A2W1LD84_9BACL|nr:DUF4446 family protein [Paenibacillus sambharensis]PZD96619.1 DUF4446 domain-containing protein [Paenibacillus sambharensis]